MQKSYCYTPGIGVGVRVGVHMQNVRANVNVMEFQFLCIFSCILTLLIILIKPLTTKSHDRRASGDCGMTVAPLVLIMYLHNLLLLFIAAKEKPVSVWSEGHEAGAEYGGIQTARRTLHHGSQGSRYYSERFFNSLKLITSMIFVSSAKHSSI